MVIGFQIASLLFQGGFKPESSLLALNQEQKVMQKDEIVSSPVEALFATAPPINLANHPSDRYPIPLPDKSLTYQPSCFESFLVNHMKELYLVKPAPQYVPTCHIWRNPTATPYFHELMSFVKELERYNQKIKAYRGVPDIRQFMDPSHAQHRNSTICELLELDPKGLPALFPNSQQLSLTRAGYVEPLLPPMRHPQFCIDMNHQNLMSIDYLVHDFAAMCRQMKPTSRTVFVDIGASLSFHQSELENVKSPAVSLIELYQKFGFVFDHIYAYERQVQDPARVYAAVPKHLRAAYHWFNVAVASHPESDQNPFNILLDNFKEDDLIIVKLDIDDSTIETQLARQLLNDPRLSKLVDQFYWEHHVHQEELRYNWVPSGETIQESFELFTGLRQKGVAAHFWV
jgi:hypothetical protein